MKIASVKNRTKATMKRSQSVDKMVQYFLSLVEGTSKDLIDFINKNYDLLIKNKETDITLFDDCGFCLENDFIGTRFKVLFDKPYQTATAITITLENLNGNHSIEKLVKFNGEETCILGGSLLRIYSSECDKVGKTTTTHSEELYISSKLRKSSYTELFIGNSPCEQSGYTKKETAFYDLNSNKYVKSVVSLAEARSYYHDEAIYTLYDGEKITEIDNITYENERDNIMTRGKVKEK